MADIHDGADVVAVDTDGNEDQQEDDTVVAVADKPKTGKTKKKTVVKRILSLVREAAKDAFSKSPSYVTFLAIFVLTKSMVEDMHAVFITLGPYRFSAAIVFMAMAFAISVYESIRASTPGKDKTLETLGVLGAGGIYLIVYIIGAAQHYYKGGGIFVYLFSNTEFLSLTLMVLTTGCLGYALNVRTSLRAIQQGAQEAGAAEEDSHDD